MSTNEVTLHKMEINGSWYSVKMCPDGDPAGYREFTPGSYIFEVPIGITQLKVSGTAGGAGGHSGHNAPRQYGGWGGGAGQWVKDYIINVTPGESLPIEVGKGGEGSTYPWSAGTNGGSTFVGPYLQLQGGRNNHSGGSNNGGRIIWGFDGVNGLDSLLANNINSGAGGGSRVHSINEESKLMGGAGGNDPEAATTGGAGGIVTSTYGAGGSGGGAGYGGNGGAGGSCDGTSSAFTDAYNPSYSGQDAEGLGAGGGGGATLGTPSPFWGNGGNGGDGYLKIEWS